MGLVFLGYDINGQPMYAPDANGLAGYTGNTAYSTGSPGSTAWTGQGPAYQPVGGTASAPVTPMPAPREVDPVSITRAGNVNAIQGTIKDASTQNKALNQQLINALNQQQGAVNNANMIDQNAIGSLWSGQQNARAGFQNVANNVTANANNANSLSNALYGGYYTAQAGLNTQDQAALTNYMNETNPLMTALTARSSDPADLARQMSAYNMASGIAGGSLDYQAALAQAVLAQTQTYASDPADIARQQQMYNTLAGVGGGSLDYSADQWTSNPEDVANQKKALDIINSRTDVTPTAQEALLYELNRRQRESDDQSSRAAVLDNLAARGLRSGGAQTAMLQQGGAQRSQDRVLADMIANAGAVERARQYTGMSADLSTAIRGQGDQVGMFNTGQANNAKANNQGTRLSGYMGAANQSNAIRNANDQVGMFNTGEINTTNRFNAGLQTQTNQFNAGQINQASANNQSTRLNGAQLTALQSNAIRSANDSQRQYEDTYAQNEATRIGNQAAQRLTGTLGTTAQIGGRNTTTYDSGQDVITNNYNRTDHANQTDWDVAAKNYGMDQDYFNAVTGAGDRAVTRAGGLVGNTGGVASIQSGLKTTDIDNLIRALDVDESTIAAGATRRRLGL